MRLILLIVLASYPMRAQWPTQGGKVDPAAKVRRTRDGKPDLSGVWTLNDQKYWYDIGADLKDGVPMQPGAAALFAQRKADEGKDNPIARCKPAGVPTIDTIPLPFKIIQNRNSTTLLYEFNMEYRQVFTEGRALPRDANPNFLGYSVGRWEKDVLVVETIGLKDETWLDMFGHPATDGLLVTERFHRRDIGNLDLDITMTDPKAYTKPWTISLHMKLMPNQEVMEYLSIENNRGMEHMVGK
jgi:hypothetical protein